VRRSFTVDGLAARWQTVARALIRRREVGWSTESLARLAGVDLALPLSSTPSRPHSPGAPTLIASDRTGRRMRDALPIRLSSVPHPIGVPAIADHEPPPAWQSGRYQPDADAWQQLRPQLRLGQELTGTVAWMIRPGATGIGVDLGLPVGGFVDVVQLPFDPGRWPALGTVTSFTVWWIDERPQIRLVPTDPRLRREDFGTWIQQQATPAAAAFRERQSSGPGGREASIEHPGWAPYGATATGSSSPTSASRRPSGPPGPAETPAPSGSGTETAFDYGALGMIVIRTDASGQCRSVSLCP
jgi:hypothetical protein